MSKAAFLRARIEPDLKEHAEAVLHELGITPTQAMTMLYKYLAREHELPIKLKIPNAETLTAFEETDQGKGLTRCKDVDDLFDKVDI